MPLGQEQAVNHCESSERSGPSQEEFQNNGGRSQGQLNEDFRLTASQWKAETRTDRPDKLVTSIVSETCGKG